MKVGEKRKSVLIFQIDSLNNTWKIIGCVFSPSQSIISQSAVKPKHVCLHRKAFTPSVSHRSVKKNTTAATSTPVTSCNSSSCLTFKGVLMLQFAFAALSQLQGSRWATEVRVILKQAVGWIGSDLRAIQPTMPDQLRYRLTKSALPQRNHKHPESRASKFLDLMIQIKAAGHCSLIPAHNLQP